MRTRMMQNGLLIALAPVVSMILVYLLEDWLILQLCAAAAGISAQIAAICYVKHDMKKLIHPSAALLAAMDLGSAPAAYVPGRLKWDVRIGSALSWLSVTAPLFVLAAQAVPAPLEPAGLLPLGGKIVLVGIGVVLVSNTALMFWARAEQANFIANQNGERRRYLLQGFAEQIDKPGVYARYLSVQHPEKADSMTARPRYEMD